ncbi:hypothetical protein BJ742DRAFT_855590 [Cladochytrium replicatum]|nr:hypothetical protein BJ742DRAFT_855590 [Cladochytrium replicatum]
MSQGVDRNNRRGSNTSSTPSTNDTLLFVHDIHDAGKRTTWMGRSVGLLRRLPFVGSNSQGLSRRPTMSAVDSVLADRNRRTENDSRRDQNQPQIHQHANASKEQLHEDPKALSVTTPDLPSGAQSPAPSVDNHRNSFSSVNSVRTTASVAEARQEFLNVMNVVRPVSYSPQPVVVYQQYGAYDPQLAPSQFFVQRRPSGAASFKSISSEAEVAIGSPSPEGQSSAQGRPRVSISTVSSPPSPMGFSYSAPPSPSGKAPRPPRGPPKGGFNAPSPSPVNSPPGFPPGAYIVPMYGVPPHGSPMIVHPINGLVPPSPVVYGGQPGLNIPGNRTSIAIIPPPGARPVPAGLVPTALQSLPPNAVPVVPVVRTGTPPMRVSTPMLSSSASRSSLVSLDHQERQHSRSVSGQTPPQSPRGSAYMFPPNMGRVPSIVTAYSVITPSPLQSVSPSYMFFPPGLPAAQQPAGVPPPDGVVNSPTTPESPSRRWSAPTLSQTPFGVTVEQGTATDDLTSGSELELVVKSDDVTAVKSEGAVSRNVSTNAEVGKDESESTDTSSTMDDKTGALEVPNNASRDLGEKSGDDAVSDRKEDSTHPEKESTDPLTLARNWMLGIMANKKSASTAAAPASASSAADEKETSLARPMEFTAPGSEETAKAEQTKSTANEIAPSKSSVENKMGFDMTLGKPIRRMSEREEHTKNRSVSPPLSMHYPPSLPDLHTPIILNTETSSILTADEDSQILISPKWAAPFELLLRPGSATTVRSNQSPIRQFGDLARPSSLSVKPSRSQSSVPGSEASIRTRSEESIEDHDLTAETIKRNPFSVAGDTHSMGSNTPEELFGKRLPMISATLLSERSASLPHKRNSIVSEPPSPTTPTLQNIAHPENTSIAYTPTTPARSSTTMRPSRVSSVSVSPRNSLVDVPGTASLLSRHHTVASISPSVRSAAMTFMSTESGGSSSESITSTVSSETNEFRYRVLSGHVPKWYPIGDEPQKIPASSVRNGRFSTTMTGVELWTDELALKPGQVVVVWQQFEDAWAEGYCPDTMESGYFPLNCLRLTEEQIASARRASEVASQVNEGYPSKRALEAEEHLINMSTILRAGVRGDLPRSQSFQAKPNSGSSSLPPVVTRDDTAEASGGGGFGAKLKRWKRRGTIDGDRRDDEAKTNRAPIRSKTFGAGTTALR